MIFKSGNHVKVGDEISLLGDNTTYTVTKVEDTLLTIRPLGWFMRLWRWFGRLW